MSDSVRPHGLQPTRLLRPWDFLGKSTGVGCHCLLQFNSWIEMIHWRRDRLSTPVFLGFLYGSAGKESACNAGNLGLMPGLGRSPEEGKGYALQYSGLEHSMDYTVHGVTKSWTWLSDFHFHSIFPEAEIFISFISSWPLILFSFVF